MSPPKNCAVCGDKALGYNFSAVTCESCKAFFRRNALANKTFTCPFNQNCEITTVTRRFCQKCRLKKCLDIGMKSENIMSEEDKLIKRRKIENNRAKRRLTEPKSSAGDSLDSTATIKMEESIVDSSCCDVVSPAYDSQSCGSFDSAHGGVTNSPPTSSTSAATLLLGEPELHTVNPELLTGEEMVQFIVCDPDRASQAISRIMRTPKEALIAIEKIINSQKDALKLISHLIAYPGDALKIISKIMNSPFDALTVFTKFMSSPTDALEIISKVVSSPQDVLQFIRNLMDSPEDALDIMNKFMNTPAEALKILNKIFNGQGELASLVTKANETTQEKAATVAIAKDSAQSSPAMKAQTKTISNERTLIHSMLDRSPNPNDSLIPPLVTPMTPINSPPDPMFPPYITSTAQTMSINSPLSVATSEIHGYHSPTCLQHDEQPSTSAGFITPPHTVISSSDAANADFANEHFDIKNLIQNSFPENVIHSRIGESINSLESVLTEVIRIEYEAFNNLPPEPRIKQERQQGSCMQKTLPHGEQGQQQELIDIHGHSCYTAQSQATQLPQQPICAPSSVTMGRDLNETEQMKLRELKLASEALYYPVDDDLSVLMMSDDRIKHSGDTHQDPKLMQLINLTAVAIKRLIKMAKKITAFRDMCQEDQVALLKGGCTEMMIMRSVMTYDDDRNMWKIPHLKEDMSNIRADVLKLAKGNVYEEHLKFIRTFDEKWRMDENIILIMCAIVLFTPTRSRVVHSDVIRLEQNSYYYLLRRYLESVYPGCEAKSAFIKLIQKISDVERLNQFIIGVYLNVNPSQVEPLLREIFDLKNH